MVRALIVVRPDDADASRLADAVADGLRDGGVFTHLCAACTAPDGPPESWEMLIDGFRSHPDPRPEDRLVRFRATLRRSPHIPTRTPTTAESSTAESSTPESSTPEPSTEVELSGTMDVGTAWAWGLALADLVRSEVASRDIDRFAGL